MFKFRRINFKKITRHWLVKVVIVLMLLALGSFSYAFYQNHLGLTGNITQLQQQLVSVKAELEKTKSDYDALKNQDQVKRNNELEAQIAQLQKGYDRAAKTYEDLLSFRDRGGKTSTMETELATALAQLSQKKYDEAVKTLDKLDSEIKTAEEKASAAVTIPKNVPVNNTPPSSGYSRQTVSTTIGSYLVDLVAGDLSNTKVIVDTASGGTCANDCPVLPLSTYVSRNSAYAGVNGSYFCPASYPSCAGKTNSFDLLLMNKNKVYFNSDNNVYSNNPGVIFGGSYIRFVTAVSQWGRDTGIDSMISNYPLLVLNKNVYFHGDSDPKKGSKGNRSFVANKGSQVFIGVVHNVTVAESAIVLQAMGMDNALNLDDGGSTALWAGGYKVGPGRNLPNVILFVRK